jgi:hypothetical protein
MAASLRPIAVEVSQLWTSLAAASDVTVEGSTVRGHVAIAGTAPTSERLVRPLAWKKRSSARRAVTMHLREAGRCWSLAVRTSQMTSPASSSAALICPPGHHARMQWVAYRAYASTVATLSPR